MNTDTQQLERADIADALLSHPLLPEALNDYEQRLVEAWKTSKARAHADREELHRMLQAQAHFRAYLTQVIVTGKLIRAKARKPGPLERAREAISSLTGARR